MLQFIAGLSGTGKTEQVFRALAQRAAAGQPSLLLVPEQATSWAEGECFRRFGDAGSGFVTVESFTGYAEMLLKQYGGTAVQTMTDAGRTVYVRRAMDAVENELSHYKKYRRSTHFCSLCADVIKELKIAGVAPATFLQVTSGPQDDDRRLHELALVYNAYAALLGNTAMDASDRVTLAAEKMDAQLLANTAVFIDDFSGFTAPEYAMLQRLLAAQSCTVTLCCDDVYGPEYTLFSPVRHTYARLVRMAQQGGVAVGKTILCEKDFRHAACGQLAALNRTLAGAPTKCAGESFTLTQDDSVYGACTQVAAHIALLVRTQGLRCRDIAVVCRSAAPWAAEFAAACARAEIPVFLDENTTPEYTPAARFCRAAFSLLRRGLSTEGLLQLAKTGLCGLAQSDIALLENYAYTWRLVAAEWRAPFTRNPSGYVENESGEDRAGLAAVEKTRAFLVPPVEKFLQACKKATAAQVCRRLYLLLDELGGTRHITEMTAELQSAGHEALCGATLQAWNSVMELLNHMALLLGEDVLEPAELEDLFLLLLRGTELGSVPQTQDAVTFTTADRMRLSGVKVCFLLGVNEDAFPASVGFSGLLTHADRERLLQNEIEMPGAYETRTLLEQTMFYRAITAAACAVHVHYLSPAVCGVPLADAMAPLVEQFAPQPVVLSAAQLSPTVPAALERFGEVYRADTEEAASLQAALRAQPALAPTLAAMRDIAQDAPYAASADTMHALLGRQLTLSPTRVESFFKCRFAYFVQYVLGIRARRTAEISPLTGGNLVHAVLERTLREAGARFAEMEEEELRTLAFAIAQQYIREVMPGEGARYAFLLQRIQENIVTLLQYMQEEQRQSDFHPYDFEVPIGGQNAAFEPIALQTPTGEAVQVVGKIDRVDVMETGEGTYIRVVDYKTGAKEFSLKDVYCGLDMQMLLYLFTLCKNGGEKLKNPMAAGVLYLKADPAPTRAATRAEAGTTPTYKVDGLVLADETVLHGMSRDGSKLFLPVVRNANGTLRAGNKMLASLEKMGNIEQHIESLLVDMAGQLYAGDIAAVPLCEGKTRPCDVCEYRAVCRHEDGTHETQLWAPKDVFEAAQAAQEPAAAKQQEEEVTVRG